MSGIIYPMNWREIIGANNVLTGTQRSNIIILRDELLLAIDRAVMSFRGWPFCLACSGGIDSSVLATLLISEKINFTAVTVGSSENHPDIIHAKILQKRFGFEHKIFILPKTRISTDVYQDLFSAIADFGFQNAMCADTVDEMLGGYWMHQKPGAYCCENIEDKLAWTFEKLWKKLPEDHLEPLSLSARRYKINVVLPYLATNDLLRSLIMEQRVNETETKIILRKLAREIGVPEAIITRPKLGLCSIWD